MVSQWFQSMFQNWIQAWGGDAVPVFWRFFSLFCYSVVGFTLVGRFSTYYLERSKLWYAREFEKRVYRYLGGQITEPKNMRFPDALEWLLKKTSHEVFVLRDTRRKRHFDAWFSLLDRIYGIREAITRMTEDAKLWFDFSNRKEPEFEHQFEELFISNPSFQTLFGFFSVNSIVQFSRFLIHAPTGVGILFALWAVAKDPQRMMDPIGLKRILSFIIVGYACTLLLHFMDALFSTEKKSKDANQVMALSTALVWKDLHRTWASKKRRPSEEIKIA